MTLLVVFLRNFWIRKKADISVTDVFNAEQLLPKQFRWIYKTSGQRKKIWREMSL